MPEVLEIAPVEPRIPPTQLHPKHRKFVNEYLKTGSAKRAALSAGYSTDYAGSIGCQLLNVPKIRQAVNSRLQKLDISAERTIREIAIRAYGNVEDLLTFDANGVPRYDLANATRDQLALVAEVRVDETGGSGDGERVAVRRVTIKPVDQLKALELLAKHQHLLDQRIEIDVGDELGNRLLRARSRAIDATPEQAQSLIDTHSQQVTEQYTYDDSFEAAELSSTNSASTHSTLGAAPQPNGLLPEFSTSLRPMGVGGQCVPSTQNLKNSGDEVTGIIATSAVKDIPVAAEVITLGVIEAMKARFSAEEFAERMKECELGPEQVRLVKVPKDLLHLL